MLRHRQTARFAFLLFPRGAVYITGVSRRGLFDAMRLANRERLHGAVTPTQARAGCVHFFGRSLNTPPTCGSGRTRPPLFLATLDCCACPPSPFGVRFGHAPRHLIAHRFASARQERQRHHDPDVCSQRTGPYGSRRDGYATCTVGNPARRTMPTWWKDVPG